MIWLIICAILISNIRYLQRGGENINGFEYYRKNAGLTQTDVAEALNVTQATVCNWEQGRSFPTGAKIPAIAALYNCQIGDLYAGTGKTKAERDAEEMRAFRAQQVKEG